MKIQQTLLTAACLTFANAAHADLTFQQLATDGVVARTEAFNNISGLNTLGVGTLVTLGKLLADQAGTISFTYLGQESSYNDSFRLYVEGPDKYLYETDSVGKTVSAQVDAGAINFRFEGNTGKYAYNAGTWDTGTSIGLITGATGSKANSFQFILGYNDSAGSSKLGDWDDFVVGVNFTPVSVVPEADTYAMLLLGLGFMGTIARRRQMMAGRH